MKWSKLHTTSSAGRAYAKRAAEDSRRYNAKMVEYETKDDGGNTHHDYEMAGYKKFKYKSGLPPKKRSRGTVWREALLQTQE